MAGMSDEFTERPPNPETNPSPGRGIAPPGKITGVELLDRDEAPPPRGLVPRRWHISFWIAIALLLGAIVGYFLLNYAVE